MSNGLSVVIPVFNEEKSIDLILSTLISNFSSMENFEIVVVDDGSTDGTKRILQDHKEILVIESDCNRGYGAALKCGIKQTKYGDVMILDGDGTYIVENFKEFYDNFNGSLLIGARRPRKANARTFLRNVLRYVASLMVGKYIVDLNSGLRVFSKEKCFEFWNLYPKGFSFTTTMTMSFLSKGYEVSYSSIEYLERGEESKMKVYQFWQVFCAALRMGTVHYSINLLFFLFLGILFLTVLTFLL